MSDKTKRGQSVTSAALLAELLIALRQINNAESALRENRLLHCDNNIRAARESVRNVMNKLEANAAPHPEPR